MVNFLINVVNWVATFVTAYIVVVKSKGAFASGVETYSRTHSQQALTSVPGICTAWGIFFTFFSIVLCLVIMWLVGDGSNFSIFNITGSIIPAFITSLIGMGFSIHYTNKIRNLLAEDESKETTSYGNPSDLLAKIAQDTHTTAMFLTGQAKVKLKQIEDSLNQLNERLEKSISITYGLNEPLKEIKEKQDLQIDSLQRFVNSFTEEFNKFFTAAHSSFEQQMKDFTTEEVEKYSQTLIEVSERLSTVTENILNTQKASIEEISNRVLDQLAQSNDTVSERLRNYSSETEDGMKQSTIIISSTLKDVISQIQSLTMQNKELITELQAKQKEATESAIQSQNTIIKESTQSMKQIMDDYSESMKNNMDTVQSEVTSSLRESSQTAALAIGALTKELKDKLVGLTSKITEASEEPLKTLKDEIEFVTERVGQICSNYQQAQVAYSDALKNAHNANEIWEQSLQSNKDALDSIKETNEHVSKVLDVMTQRDEGIKQLRKEISGVSETIVQLQELNSILTKISNK